MIDLGTRKITIEDGVITSEDRFNPTYKFEIVDHVPLGFEIWNVHVIPGEYLPLCRLSKYQRFEGGRQVEVETLKAIKCDGVEVMLRAASLGIRTLEQAEKIVNRYAKYERKPKYKAEELKRAKAALPYMQKLKWN